jgi:hypothetical protein
MWLLCGVKPNFMFNQRLCLLLTLAGEKRPDGFPHCMYPAEYSGKFELFIPASRCLVDSYITSGQDSIEYVASQQIWR